MNNTAIFATSCIDLDPQRYQYWIDYYSDFFADYSISLWMINDGPFNTALDMKSVELRSFDEKLGRQTVWIFPGWKRSFFHALLWLSRKYKYIAHIESDCWLTSKAKSEFLHYLSQEGYFTGFVPSYDFPEASLQIINNTKVRQYIIDKYACVENWHENIDFEKDLKRLKPTYILNGDRIEDKMHRWSSDFTFVSGMKYQDFQRIYGLL